MLSKQSIENLLLSIIFQSSTESNNEISRYLDIETYHQGYIKALNEFIIDFRENGPQNLLEALNAIKSEALSAKERDLIDIHDFLKKANEKAVGRVCITADFCFLNSFWYLDKDDLASIQLIREAMDSIFKGCNIYDDIADIWSDVHNHIINSVIYLALDQGQCEKKDIYNDPKDLIVKLEKEGTFYLALELGDLMFQKGLRLLDKAREYPNRIDIDALKFGTYILRIFSMRKWLARHKRPRQFFKPFSLKISDRILEYSKYV